MAAGLALAGCGSSRAPVGEVGVFPEGGAFGGDDGAGAGTVSVSVTPASALVCAGQCADLTASASGGVAPYTYAWDHGLGASASQHVCPEATTAYSVTATDSSGQAGEVVRPSATGSAQATVTVSASCSDAGVPLDDGGTPPATVEAQVTCSASWSVTPGWFTVLAGSLSTGGTVAVDPSGNLVVAYSVLQSDGTIAGVVRKLDASCHDLWQKQYTATFVPSASEASVQPAWLAVDASSNILVAGTGAGTYDFGNGTIGNAILGDEWLIELDPNGNALWSKAFTPGTAVLSLSVTPGSGQIVVLASGLSGSDFGGGPVLGGPQYASMYLARYGADGSFVSATLLDPAASNSIDLSAGITAGSGALWISGESGVALPQASGTAIPAGQAFLAQLNASATFQSALSLTPSVMPGYVNMATSGSGTFFAMIAQPDPMALDGGAEDDAGYPIPSPTASRSLLAFASGGTPAWKIEAPFAHEVNSTYLLNGGTARLAVYDHGGDLVVGGEATAGMPYARRIDASGNVGPMARWKGSGGDHLVSMAADPSGPLATLVWTGDLYPYAQVTSPRALTVSKVTW